MPTIKGTTYWYRPYELTSYGNWEISLIPDDVEDAKKHGLTLKTREGIPEPYVLFRRKAKTNTGKDRDAPRVVDGRKNPWPKDVFIGNGSKVTVLFSNYEWKDNSIAHPLEAVQINELVEYIRDPISSFEEDGFDVNEFKEEKVHSEETKGVLSDFDE